MAPDSTKEVGAGWGRKIALFARYFDLPRATHASFVNTLNAGGGTGWPLCLGLSGRESLPMEEA
jgi:hypothetical protein